MFSEFRTFQYIIILLLPTLFIHCIQVGDNPARVTEIIQSMEAGSSRSQLPESVESVSVSDPVESDIDDDVPYFSDIEAMV